MINQLDANGRIKDYHSGPRLNTNSHTIVLEKTKKWIRAKFENHIVINSKNASILFEDGHLPTYYFPKTDINMNLLNKSNKTSNCPFKGDATYWDLKSRDKKYLNSAWSYENPIKGQEGLKGLIAFYWSKIDNWYEEEEEIFSYPRDPYVRIDTLRSSRNIEVYIKNELILSSSKSIILFETHKSPKYFFSINDIKVNLVFSETVFRCPYKGISNYLSIKEDNKFFKDVIMQYTQPKPEVSILKNLVCFDVKPPLTIKVS